MRDVAGIGTIDFNNKDVTINGNAHMSEIVVENDNKMIFGGGGNTEFWPGSQRYNNFRVNKDSGNDTVWVAVDGSNDTVRFVKMNVQKGVFSASVVDVSGDADFSGGTLEASLIKLTGAEIASMSSGSNTLQSVVINKSGGGELSFQDDRSGFCRFFYWY